MSAEELAITSTLVSILALFAAVFSAFAAFRGAGVARDAEKRTAQVVQDDAHRELKRSQARFAAEVLRADRLLVQAENERKAVALLTNTLGGSRHTLYEDFIRGLRLELEDLRAEVSMVAGDVAAQQVGLDAALIRVLSTKELAATEYTSLRTERHLLSLRSP